MACVLLVTNHGGLGERVNSPAPQRPVRWAEWAADHGSLDGIQQQSVVYDADPTLHVAERVPRKCPPTGPRGEEAEPGPGIDSDAAVAQLGQCVFEYRAGRAQRARVDDDIDAQRPDEIVVGGGDRGPEECQAGARQLGDGQHGGEILDVQQRSRPSPCRPGSAA